MLRVGLNGIQHLLLVLVTTYLGMKHAQNNPEEAKWWDPQISALSPAPGQTPWAPPFPPPGFPAPPLLPSPSHFVGRNVCEAAQGGLKEPKELQWPLQSPERHDAALGRLDAGGRGYWGQWPRARLRLGSAQRWASPWGG